VRGRRKGRTVGRASEKGLDDHLYVLENVDLGKLS
jgi:hypothetical protein